MWKFNEWRLRVCVCAPSFSWLFGQKDYWTDKIVAHYSSCQRINTGERIMRKRGTQMEEDDRITDKEWKEREACIDTRRAGAYLTDNVVIVRQVVSVSLGSGRRGVTQFPYIWLWAVGCCRNWEAVRLWLTALWAVLTAESKERQVCDKYCESVNLYL